MVKITRDSKETLFEIKGFHKVLAFKSELRIPNDHILDAYFDPTQVKEFKGVRALGTHIPTLITAGTFFQWQGGDTVFMDVVDDNKAIVIELKDEYFKKLIIEVKDPADAIAVLTRRFKQ